MPGVTRVLHEVEKQRRGKWYEIKDLYAKLKAGDPIPLDNEKGLLLGAWMPEFLERFFMPAFRARYPTARIGVLWTSTIAQSEQQPQELEFLRQIRTLIRAKVIDYVWFGDGEWLGMFDDWGSKSFYAPYPLSMRKKQPKPDDTGDDVSFFGPTHYRKNVWNQLLAAKFAGMTVHINTASEQLKQLAQDMKLSCIYHQWMDELTRDRTIATMRMGLQVSHIGVESRSYVVADHLMQGTPCLTSVEWVPTFLRCNPSDVHEIVIKLKAQQAKDTPESLREWIKTRARYWNEAFHSVFTTYRL